MSFFNNQVRPTDQHTVSGAGIIKNYGVDPIGVVLMASPPKFVTLDNSNNQTVRVPTQVLIAR